MIDILLLTYNNLFSTKKCIDNLYKYTDDFKLFILDNNSKDGTVDYLKLLSEMIDNVFINFQQENYGIIKGRNKCFDFNRESSDSQNIMFLDNDQMVQLEWLKTYEIMMKNFDLVGIEAWKIRERDFYPYRKAKEGETYNYVGVGGLMLNAKLFEELGKFDEDYEFIYFEDPDLCFKAYYKGYKVGWNYHQVIEHHHKGKLLSNKNKKYFISNWRIFQEKWRGKKVPIFGKRIKDI